MRGLHQGKGGRKGREGQAGEDGEQQTGHRWTAGWGGCLRRTQSTENEAHSRAPEGEWC